MPAPKSPNLKANLCGGILLAIFLGFVFLTPPSGNRPKTPANEFSVPLDEARTYLAHGETAKARAMLTELLAQSPTHTEAHFLMAKTLMPSGDYAKIYGHLSQSLAAKPDQEEAQFVAGVVAVQLEKHDAALQHYSLAERLNPNSAKYPLYKGTALLALNRVDEAEQQADTAQKFDASLPEVHALRAKIAEKRGDTPAALTHASKALELLTEEDEKYVSYVVYKSHLLTLSGRADDGLTLLLGLPQSEQSKEMVTDHLAQAYLALKQPAKAVGIWAALFIREPQNARAAAETGLCLIAAGSPEQAAKYLRLAQRIAPNHPKVRELAKALRTGGDSAGATR